MARVGKILTSASGFPEYPKGAPVATYRDHYLLGENMRAAEGTYFDLRQCAPMERAEELRCAREYRRTREASLAEQLIRANMRLVVKIAKGYQRGTTDLRDLVQEGNLGLLHAVAKFDPDRGVKLCSYAAWWIRAYILKYTVESWRLVKAGTTQAQRKLFFRLRREQHKFDARGVEASVKELAATLRVKEEEVASMLERFAGQETSLDAPMNSRDLEGRAPGDWLGAPPALQPDVQVEREELLHTLQQSLVIFASKLRGRELAIFRRRLLTDEPDTLASLAVTFGVTRERTRQLEQRLKGRIREHLRQDLGDAVAPHVVTPTRVTTPSERLLRVVPAVILPTEADWPSPPPRVGLRRVSGSLPEWVDGGIPGHPDESHA